MNIKFLVKLSVVPNLPEDIKFKFIDVVMKNEVIIRALPSIEIIIALTDGYPSH